LISFPSGLFAELDRSVDDNTLGIKTYGVCMTTLEEVFLKIGMYLFPIKKFPYDITVTLELTSMFRLLLASSIRNFLIGSCFAHQMVQ